MIEFNNPNQWIVINASTDIMVDQASAKHERTELGGGNGGKLIVMSKSTAGAKHSLVAFTWNRKVLSIPLAGS